ncbi:MAG TPA: hypothetical protein VG457_01115 [Planctomycetota bacterium]|nr:hypothetical protein [Planctomycetota bacterium]
MLFWFVVSCSLFPDTDTGDSRSRENPIGLDVRASTQAWYAVPKGWLNITLGSQPFTATHADIGSDISLDPDVAPVLEARMKFTGSQGCGIRVAQIDAEGSGTADESFTYHGDVFGAGRRVRSELDFLLLQGDYQFTFNPGDDLEVSAHAGAQFWSFSGRLRTLDAGPLLTTQRAFASAFWLAGIDFLWKAGSGLELRASAVGGDERTSQYFWEAEGDALLWIAGSVTLTAGYRIHVIRFRQSTNQSNLKFFGPTLGLEIAF